MSHIVIEDLGEHATADLFEGHVTALFVKQHDEELWEVWGFRLDGVEYREPDGREIDNLPRLPEGKLNTALTHALEDHRARV